MIPQTTGRPGVLLCKFRICVFPYIPDPILVCGRTRLYAMLAQRQIFHYILYFRFYSLAYSTANRPTNLSLHEVHHCLHFPRHSSIHFARKRINRFY